MLGTVFFLQAHTCPEQQDVLLNVRCLLKVIFVLETQSKGEPFLCHLYLPMLPRSPWSTEDMAVTCVSQLQCDHHEDPNQPAAPWWQHRVERLCRAFPHCSPLPNLLVNCSLQQSARTHNRFADACKSLALLPVSAPAAAAPAAPTGHSWTHH